MKNFDFLFLLSLFLLVNFTISTNVASSKTANSELYHYFSPNIRLTASDTLYSQHVEPTMAIGPNNQIFVGWKEADSPDGGGLNVSFSKSTDGGITWTNPIQMPNNYSNTYAKSDAWMYYYNNTLYYSYLEYNLTTINYSGPYTGHYSQVTMARSTDNGTTWTTAKASQNKYFADKEAFTVSSNGTIYLTYDDINPDPTAGGSVVLSKSIDNGLTFSDIANVTDSVNEDIVGPYPAVSSNGTLFVAWSKFNDSNNYFGDVYYDFSLDGGHTFTNNTDLNLATENGWAYNWKATLPVAKFDSHNRLYVMWSEFENPHWQIYLRYSDDFGLHWSNKIPINQTTNSDQWQPDFAIDSNSNLHVAWLDESYQNYQPYQYRPHYMEINFTGTNRDTISKSAVIPVASAYTAGTFYRPGDYLTIQVDSNNIPHVVWTDGRLDYLNIYYSHLIISNTPPPTSSSSLSSSTNVNTNTSSNSKSKSSPSFTMITIFLTIPIYIGFKRIKVKK